MSNITMGPIRCPPSCRFCQKPQPISRASLLGLPYELREQILKYALKSRGAIELQHPVWAGLSVFNNPLFQVCRDLRRESIAAFYQTNNFLWIIDVEHKSRSDPATYPSPSAIVHNGRYVPALLDPVLPSPLPWDYPSMLRSLRHLQINVYLPREQHASGLQQRLEALVKALDRGRRLADFHVLITAKRRAAQIPLSGGEVRALEGLAEMEIRGRVEVQTRYYFRAVNASVDGMGLARRMKA